MKRNIIIRSAAVLLVLIVAVLAKPFASAMLGQMMPVSSSVTEDSQNAEAAQASDSSDIQPSMQADPDTKDNPAEATEDGILPPGDLRNDPDYIALLKTMYTQDDIDRMYAPRQWVVMPNVIGMTEAQALAAMHAVGLVGRVVYEDHNYAQGVCFAQDAMAGREWNTDASIFIWVQTVKDPPGVTPAPVINIPLSPDPTTPAAPVDPLPAVSAEPSQAPQPSTSPEDAAPTASIQPSDSAGA